MVRYAETVSHGLGYDAKNMMHTIRLLEVARDLLSSGKLILKRPNRDELLDIKSGKWSYGELCEKVTQIREEIVGLYMTSALPEVQHIYFLEKYFVQTREVLYQ